MAGGEREHRRDRCHRFGELMVARRQLRQGVGYNRRQAGHLARDLGRRKPIWFGEDDVDAEDARVPFGDSADELGYPVPRPRPLPISSEAFLVDVDGHHSCRITGAGPHSFYQVEAAHAQFGDDAGVDDAQRQCGRDQRECGRAARTPQHSDAPDHRVIARHNSSSSPS